MCGKAIPAGRRADATTCSNACRQKRYRRGPPLSEEDWAAIRKVNAMSHMLPRELQRPAYTREEIRAHVAATAVRTGEEEVEEVEEDQPGQAAQWERAS